MKPTGEVQELYSLTLKERSSDARTSLCTCYTTNNPLEEGQTTHLFTGEENS